MINHNEWLVVGLITSPHGINGKIKVKSLSDFEERFTKPGKRWIQKEKEIPSELELSSLKNYKVLVKINDIPKLNKNEFHLTELLNLKVKIYENNKSQIIGKVINLENENNNLIVIKLLKNNKEVLVPFVKEIIPIVDIKNKFLVMTPPSGLLEL